MPFNSKLLPNKTRFNWRMVRRHKHAVSLCTRIMFFSTAALACSGIAVAGGLNPVVTSGSGSVELNDKTTDVFQGSPVLKIDWEKLSIAADEALIGHMKATDLMIHNILNDPTEIRGLVQGAGRFVFLNKSGITFFEGARVNVGSLMASTAASMTMSGGVMNFSGGGYAQIINRGDITVSDGGFAILAAPHVENSGVITANLGQVHLASATSYTLDLRGDGLIMFAVDASAMSNIAVDGEKLGVDNSGTLRAQSGQVVVTAATISQVVNSVVNLGGVVDADAFTATASGGSVLVASSGDLNLTGDIRADGGATGDGGSVVTWADDTNYFNADATISAQGGAVSGDGGFIEISGHDVRYRGTVDASATNGAAGTMLLDPINITIVDGGPDGTNLGNQTISEQTVETLSMGGTNVVLTADDEITVGPLAGGVLQGGSGNIELTTLGLVSEAVPELDEDGSPPGMVESLGRGNITMETGDTIATTSGDVKISATGWQANVTLGNVTTTQGGDIIVVATDTGFFIPAGETQGPMADVLGSNISAVNLTTNNTGDLTESAGSIDLDSNQGSVTLTGDTTITSNVERFSFGTSSSIVRLDIEADDDITITGNTVITATATHGDAHSVASAIVDIKAGIDGSGSVSVGTVGTPVEFNVVALALSTPGSEASDSATATASATMVAPN
ncbi:MAG: filamentous hemagglutinin N-terminal domain-containing protein [Rhodospirillales bacterium]|nr:filamentous hemagglutinin N-terminal domain-containing protein [Rhodospirillales bacterium]